MRFNIVVYIFSGLVGDNVVSNDVTITSPVRIDLIILGIISLFS